MDLEEGARTVIEQCLDVSREEEVALVNDGNDPDLTNSLKRVLERKDISYVYEEYAEPETHGEEPPEKIAKVLKKSDVFLAPTKKSISHTRARIEACKEGSRGATMPGINKDIWNTSLRADYERVGELSERVYSLLSDTSSVSIETPSGTDLAFDVNFDYYSKDTGIIHEPGDFGNLPAGEAFGSPVKAEGTLVIDQFPFAPGGTRVEISDSRAVSIENPAKDASELSRALDSRERARNVAEFGVGTNPEATLIGEILQDEKVLGTVHIAFGDNSSMVPEGDPRRVEADIHWDTVCVEPTVKFDGEPVIESGEPLFL